MNDYPKSKYHLIGIGGSGMSAIAHILHQRGVVVTGSDKQENDAVRRLRSEGVAISIGHRAENVHGADVVVYSAAIPSDNPELTEARRLEISAIERPEMLGRLMKPYKHRIAVAGTHGKTTTTSMIDTIFECAALDATALIGGDLKSLGGNARLGRDSIILTEACEAFGSFLHLHPSIAVITNIDADHLDYYKTVENIENAFAQFVSQVTGDGVVIACWDDARARKICERSGRRVVRYGVEGDPDVMAVDINTSTPRPSYTLVRSGRPLGVVNLGVVGMHNVLNSLSAAAAAFEMGIEFEVVARALSDFRGAGRRFEVLYDDGKVLVVDDYAHHPSEIKATLSAARSAYDKRIIAIFQPHLYSRTQIFQADIAEALSIADQVIVAPIYAAREQPIEGVGSESIIGLMAQKGYKNARYAADIDALPDELAESLNDGDMVIVLGAGDIRRASERLAELLSARSMDFPLKFTKNEPMASHTTLGVGGPADYYIEVESEEELAGLMKYISSHDLPWMILGDGANLLVSDKGIRGVVIRMRGSLTGIEVDGSVIKAGGGVDISKVADVAAERSLTGLEGVGTVPGSVGGAIVMNAGTHRGYIDAVTRSVTVVSSAGEIQTLSKEECGFTYRNSRFQTDHSLIITSATFALSPGDGSAITEHLSSVRKHRAETQPRGKSAGCFFKNPADKSAGRLIESAGAKGLREGGAEVSTVHANFIMNTGNATAADLRTLSERVRAMVREKHGIELEYEVRLVGEW